MYYRFRNRAKAIREQSLRAALEYEKLSQETPVTVRNSRHDWNQLINGQLDAVGTTSAKVDGLKSNSPAIAAALADGGVQTADDFGPNFKRSDNEILAATASNASAKSKLAQRVERDHLDEIARKEPTLNVRATIRHVGRTTYVVILELIF